MSTSTNPPAPLPIDSSLYSLSEEELAFFKKQTGIQDAAELRDHILGIQKRAYEVYSYSCIRLFEFTRLRINHLPAYQRVLQLSREREKAIFLDIGCCMGVEIRQVVADGWPIENIVASDLHGGFWECGHELFRSSHETFPVPFVQGDALDPGTIVPRAPFYDTPDTPVPDLKTLGSLTPLQGHLSAIHATHFFHLFNEEQQLALARQLASLLSPRAGSVLFGSHVAMTRKGVSGELFKGSGTHLFCHSPESWRALWDGVVFESGAVRVETEMKAIGRGDAGADGGPVLYLISWSVTRI
ncbi:hypothetical protein BD779DRAFT_597846 [Infundibulicybe gibba]|nr:hypothetical protein BD779DRAFT_597846 [Infundibulicybe gibba]